jgi:hypothetical protein
MMNAVGICAFLQSHGFYLGKGELSNRRDGTMRKIFAAAVGSVSALVGFAGAANASATIDLIWPATGTNTIPAFASSAVTLQVILTAGPAGSAGAGVSVDYSGVLGALVVTGIGNPPVGSELAVTLGPTIDTGSRVENINSTSFPPASVGTGLAAGASALLGTITFHNGGSPVGAFEIRSDANSPTDGVLDLGGGDITSTTTFNSAFITIPEPSALTALGSGIAMLALLYRRRWYCVKR